MVYLERAWRALVRSVEKHEDAQLVAPSPQGQQRFRFDFPAIGSEVAQPFELPVPVPPDDRVVAVVDLAVLRIIRRAGENQKTVLVLDEVAGRRGVCRGSGGATVRLPPRPRTRLRARRREPPLGRRRARALSYQRRGVRPARLRPRLSSPCPEVCRRKTGRSAGSALMNLDNSVEGLISTAPLSL